MSNNKPTVTAHVGWSNGPQKEPQWDLIKSFKTKRVAYAWAAWHLLTGTKRYDYATYYLPNDMKHVLSTKII